MDYKNKIVLITGAYRGIGASLAHFFALYHADLILTYHNHLDETNELKEKLINKYHVNVDTVYVNLCQEESIVDVYNYVKGKYGKIDILINNASISRDSHIIDKTKEDFMKVMEVNVVGTFLMMKYFDEIIENGHIFNISSTDGIDTGNIYSIDYNASKAAINNMTKTFSLYSKNKVICICPNWVDTESTREMDKNYLESELKRVGQRKLINVMEISRLIDYCIRKKIETGSIIRWNGVENE